MLRRILILCFSFVLLADLCHGKSSSESTTKFVSTKRILGGDVAEKGQFPYQVSFRYRKRHHFCGGAIISKRFILTAAHCTVIIYPDFEKTVTAFLGAYENFPKFGEMYHIEKYFVHPQFDHEYLINDIAVVKLVETIIFTNYIQKIEYSRLDDLPIGMSGITSGWGDTSFEGNQSKFLKYITQDIVSPWQCQRWFGPKKITSTVFCAFSLYGEGTCNGDSGGPFMSNGILIGLVSSGEPCGIGYPDVYTKVASYTHWFEMIMMKE